MYNIASNNVISIEKNNAESYSNKSNKPNNTSISTGKKVNFRHNWKKQARKKDQIVTAIVGDSMVKNIYGWELSDNNDSCSKAFQRIDNTTYDDIHQVSTET